MQAGTQGGIGSASVMRFVFGAATSALIMFLFENIQVISDLAPRFIKESSMPGILGAPVALVTAIWIVVIPMVFAVAVIRSGITGRRPWVRAYVAGAFAGLAGYAATFVISNPEVLF
ncbi:hypothetical protein [Aestuariicoccus sp. MJ-SS9]|uniref:hypothetical protein n=1 Tax=Aestuariicoccus sp. MJ-SS9 TaxID=3079855 RepID=UPI002913134A|nr:hypothetical protein [Aestuariicoccus sp. MJ-SS9]MDU8911025.1 hypothetical protein [Aestuariicoccus sp. MJ-SS9]